MRQKIIFCFGDSNTYGYDPRGCFGGRYPASVRWTARLDALPQWKIYNLGENGRTIPRGPAELYAIDAGAARLRPDGICILLGSNDVLCGASAEAAAARMDRLAGYLLARVRPVLLLAPPPFRPGTWVEDERLIEESARLSGCYREIAAQKGLAFADTGAWEIPVSFDGVHFTEEGHLRFAERAAAVFASVFA